MSSQGFVDQIARAIANVFRPLTDALTEAQANPSNPSKLTAILSDLGWDSLTSQQISSITQALQGLAGAINSVETDQSGQLLTALPPIFTQVFALESTSAAGLTDFWSTFPGDLLDYLLYKYIESQSPILGGILSFLGVLNADPMPADTTSTPNRDAHTKLTVDLSVLQTVVTDPESLFAHVYNWGGPAPTTFKYARFTNNIANLLRGVGLGISVMPPSQSVLDTYYARNSTSRSSIQQLAATPFQLSDSTTSPPVQANAKLIIALVPIPPDSDNTQPPDGFVFFPILIGSASTTFQLSQNVSLQMKGFTSANPILLEVHPGIAKVQVNLASGQSISGSAALTAQAPAPLVLLGSADATHIEASKAHLGLAANGPTGSIEYKVEFGADGFALFLDFGEADGFLSKVLRGAKQKIDLSFTAGWSSKTGFSFNGLPNLETTIPLHLSIDGVLNLESLYLALKSDGSADSVELIVAVSGGLTLGPVTVTIDKVGLQLSLKTCDPHVSPGILGKADLGFGFKPPDGLGIEVDAGPISGGGYLGYDETKAEYSGALDLELEAIHLTAFGILDTKKPDGSPGFSFVLLIKASDFPPIELGFGFTLNGIGGLAAVNRMISVTALQSGFKDHSIDKLLSPPEPVIDHAPEIISDLAKFFPEAEGIYVFGPEATIGWGTPTLITGDLGVFIEFPMPGRIVILGHITSKLPDAQTALLVINMDVLGTIDLQKKTLAIDATLFDSHLLEMTLQGDMALRFDWGGPPNFLLSIGGYNPRFKPPPGFPSLNRLSGHLALGSDITLSLSSYLAITTNTLQFGSDLELAASIAGANLNGHLSFDALIILSPFSFIVDFSAGISVSYTVEIDLGFLGTIQKTFVLAGVSISGTLSGPTPWNINGSVTIDILGCSITIQASGQFGSTTQAILPKADPLGDLIAALSEQSSWSAVSPSGADLGVSLIDSVPHGNSLLMFPTGTLTVREKVVPLKETIDLYGGTAPDTANYFEIESMEFQDSANAIGPWTSLTGTNLKDQEDYFAAGQFFKMNDSQKLTAPSFNQDCSGASVSFSEKSPVNGIPMQLQYDTIIIDHYTQPSRKVSPYQIPAIMQEAIGVIGPAAQSRAGTSGANRFTGGKSIANPISMSSGITPLQVVPSSKVSSQ